MPNTRVMLWVALAAILYLNYEAWMRDYSEPAPSAAAPSAAAPSAAAPSAAGAPAASNSLADSIPKAASAAAPSAAPSAAELRRLRPPRRRQQVPMQRCTW